MHTSAAADTSTAASRMTESPDVSPSVLSSEYILECSVFHSPSKAAFVPAAYLDQCNLWGGRPLLLTVASVSTNPSGSPKSSGANSVQKPAKYGKRGWGCM